MNQLHQHSNLEASDVLLALNSSLDGLSAIEAKKRLAKIGLNVVVSEKQKPFFLRFLSYFISPLPLLLLSLSLVAFFTGEFRGAEVIVLMVFLSTTLAFAQEYRSSKAAKSLRAMVSTKASVLRKFAPDTPGQTIELEMSQLVLGDIVHLSAGDMIPADVRLLSAKDLFVNQSSLTGESMPVEKHAARNLCTTTNMPELPNICFMGTHVVSGAAVAVAVATGRHTFFGSIASSVVGVRELTSFDRGIQKFIWLIIRIMLVMVPAVFLINGFVKGNWMEALLFASAVAVGLAPEMLPMLITINLAKGAMAMSRKKVIVKRLNAIQNFGATDILCTDKTGTLTQDKVVLERHVDIFGKDDDRVLEYAYLNSHYQSGLKNLLDIAVLEHAEVHKRLHEADSYLKVDEIPFDFQRRRMSVIVEKNKTSHLLICKGAVEEIFSVCDRVQKSSGALTLEPLHIEEVNRVVNDLNEDGFRVIAVAYKEVSFNQLVYEPVDESNLILSGYIAFLDPPKESAAPAIASLLQCGVQVKILTGDNEVVSRKICHDVGLSVDGIMLGSQIEAMTDLELANKAEVATVFAKLSPQQKARVIYALQSKNHVVGFMGDGINDGPALKVADVGISVDTAVDIAKESADIILLEKNLLVIKEGIIEGRKVFGNIIKYIRMSASSNFGNMFSVLGASAFLPFLPMAPVQILFNNLLYDFSQTSVATDSVDEEYLSKPRKWEIANISRYILTIGPISSIFDYLTFGLMWFIFDCTTPERAGLFQTAWFVESLLSQTLIVHVLRTGKIPFLQSKPSLPLLITTVVICIIGAYLPYSALAPALQMTPLPSIFWLYLAIILVLYLGLTQMVKAYLIRRFGFD
ncbi:MAG: magnesium-translocating P-type ATPase [Methylotenera sp.]|nr:magnesium-translocating P-type ATPase [Methylotenera sp.]